MYNIYCYDSERDAVVVADMDGKQLVIDCKKAEAQVVLDEPEDAGILAGFAGEEPAGYVSMAMRPGGLKDYADVWNELNRKIEMKCRLEKSDRHFLRLLNLEKNGMFGNIDISDHMWTE